MLLEDDIGIYIGSSYAYGCTRRRGIILREPAVVAVESESGRILNAGQEAIQLMEKVPVQATGVYPMENGQLAEYTTFECLLRHLIKKICKARILKPRVVLCLPDKITSVERRAAEQAVSDAGGRCVEIVYKSLAAACGAGITPGDSQGRLLVHMGGGCFIIAFISAGKLILSEKLELSGNLLDDLIFRHMKEQHGIIVSQETSENIKKNLGCFYPRDFNLKMNIMGKQISNALNGYAVIDSNEIWEIFKNQANAFSGAVVDVVKKIPVSFARDVAENGIVLTGGCSQLYGADKLLYKDLGIAVTVDKNAEHSVAEGLSQIVRLGNLFVKQE